MHLNYPLKTRTTFVEEQARGDRESHCEEVNRCWKECGMAIHVIGGVGQCKVGQYKVGQCKVGQCKVGALSSLEATKQCPLPHVSHALSILRHSGWSGRLSDEIYRRAGFLVLPMILMHYWVITTAEIKYKFKYSFI